MALTEPVRSSLYRKLEQQLGTDEATALMTHLPAFDPADIVTVDKLDLRLRESEARSETLVARLEARMEERFGTLENTIEARFGASEKANESRFGTLENTIEARFGASEKANESRFGSVEARLASLEEGQRLLPDLVSERVLRTLAFWLLPTIVSSIGVSVTLAGVVFNAS